MRGNNKAYQSVVETAPTTKNTGVTATSNTGDAFHTTTIGKFVLASLSVSAVLVAGALVLFVMSKSHSRTENPPASSTSTAGLR